MSYNGSGTFLINSAGQPVVANTVISATVFNALTADLATGLSTAITKDGQTTITANIPFGNNKITGLGSGTAATDAANLGQVQSTAAKLVTVTGTDTLTGTMSPALTAYATGQLFYFIAGAANTGAMTINIDGLGAKSITRDGATALIANDVLSGEIVVICYDGTRFQMINAANSFGNTTINGTLTVTGNAGFQANVSITSALSVGGVFAVTGASTLTGTATLTANPVLSAGTANGVLYLNGSKVATSGSAFVFDGTNLGLGVTPSAWSLITPMQIKNASFAGYLNRAYVFANSYFDGSNNKYIASDYATYYSQQSGQHQWYNAPSGTAGNTISFTQAMTLDGSGRLGIGTTSPASGTRLHMVDSAGCILRMVRTSNRFDLIADTDFLDINARDSGTYLRFLTADIERARVASTGQFLIGTTSTVSEEVLSAAGSTAGWRIGSNRTAVLGSGNAAGGFNYSGGNASSATAGVIYARVEAEVSSATASSESGALVLLTRNSGTLAERARIDSAGRLGINQTSLSTNRFYVQAVDSDTIGIRSRGINSSAGVTSFYNFYADGNVPNNVSNSYGYYVSRSQSNTESIYGVYADIVGTYGTQYGVYSKVNKNLGNYSLGYCYYADLSYSSSGGEAIFALFYNSTDALTRFKFKANGGLENYQANDTNLSDRREKKDFAPAGSYLEKICAIPVQTFKYISQTDDEPTLGVVAQDVQAVAPELVCESNWAGENEKEKMRLSIYQTDLQYALMKCIQEQQAMIKSLEAKVAALESK